MILMTSGLKSADPVQITDWSVLKNIFTEGTCRREVKDTFANTCVCPVTYSSGK